jgi:hypothetical protein
MGKRSYEKSFKHNMLERIKQISENVILRQDVKDLGSARQISRGFNDLVEMGVLVKIGYGIYAKAYLSKYIDRPVIQAGFSEVCKEALSKLGVLWEPGSAEQAYNAGLSTQVPVRTVVKLKKRFRRQLSYGNRRLIVEKGVNAR